ncbi:uncharacterized protein TNCV_272871 [Trichonephila clavipes]|nr:uncharacterized protein TNCV_272871 [Trichonephila clavipes]
MIRLRIELVHNHQRVKEAEKGKNRDSLVDPRILSGRQTFTMSSRIPQRSLQTNDKCYRNIGTLPHQAFTALCPTRVPVQATKSLPQTICPYAVRALILSAFDFYTYFQCL